MMPWSYQVMLTILVIVAAGFDIHYRRIPNWLVCTGMVWALGMNVFLFGWIGLKLSLIGVGVAFLVYFPLFILRGMGAGDVKLMMAIGALVGPANWLGILIATSLIGGAAAVLLLLWRKRLSDTLYNVLFIVGQLVRFRAPFLANQDLDIQSPKAITMPHGVTIAAGAIAFLIRASLTGSI